MTNQSLDDDGRPERLVALIGQAVTDWSKIESLWYLMFGLLVYRGIRNDAPERLPYKEQDARADAIYFSLPNSAAQRRMILALAEVVLNDKPEIFKAMQKAEERTGKLSGWRNGIVHSYYGRPMSVSGSVITWGDVVMEDHGRHVKFKDRDPLVEIPRLLKEFDKLEEETGDVFLELIGR